MQKRFAAVIIAVLFALLALSAPLSASEAPSEVYSDGSTGEFVTRIQLRLRELGYLCYRPTGAYRAMTVEAAKQFQKRCSDLGEGLTSDGKMGDATLRRLFDANAPRVKIPDSVHIPRGPLANSLSATGEMLEWSTVKRLMKLGGEYTVTDCNTGESFNLVFAGGANHAEMELARIADKAVFSKVCGVEFNYLKRPVVVNVDGRRIAASMQCYPHGSDTVENNGIDGHVCVFFAGSLSHVGALSDAEHDAAVSKAAGR